MPWLLPLLQYCLVLLSASVGAWENKAQALQQSVDLIQDASTFGIASLSTRYPKDHHVPELAGQTITGPEYFAPCYSDTGDLLFLGLTVSQSWRNVLTSSSRNATLSIASNGDPRVPDKRHLDHHSTHWQHDRPQWRRGMPSKARATLFGHFVLTNATQHPELSHKLSTCYLHHHPDAAHWAPGSKASPHVPFWATFIVDRVYWVGGFGDEHYIGWYSQSDWNAAWAAQVVHTDLSNNVETVALPDDLRSVSDYQLLFGPSEQTDDVPSTLLIQ